MNFENNQIALLDLEPSELNVEVSATYDKWLLSSALQKLVRRGSAVQSIAVAIRLHELDHNYLRRRLPIIAMEDIGFGNLDLCKEVITICADKKWWGITSSHTLTRVVSQMALSLKSRAVCDAFSLTEAHPDRVLVMPPYTKLGTTELIAIASDTERGHFERLVALRVLGGITLGDGTYRRLSHFDGAALDQVARNLGLPDTARWLIQRNTRTAGMAAMIPVVWGMLSDATVKTMREFPHAMETVGGLPLCALDKFTRLGKLAIRRYYLSTTELQGFILNFAPKSQPQKLIGMAIFHAESSILARYLLTPKMEELRAETEEVELIAMGLIDTTVHCNFLELLRKTARQLSQTRRDCLK